MCKTTLEKCIPLLQLLRYLGVLPVRFIYENVPTSSNLTQIHRIFDKVVLNVNWTYLLPRLLTIVFCLFKIVCVSYNFVQAYLRDTPELIEAMIQSGPVITIGFACQGILIAGDTRMKRTVEFINRWHKVEMKILQTLKPKSSDIINEPYAICRSLYTSAAATSIFATIFMFALAVSSPRFTIFLYSLVEPGHEIPWLFAFSVLDAIIVGNLNWPLYISVDFLAEGFPRSVSNCLKLISNGQSTSRSRLETILNTDEFYRRSSFLPERENDTNFSAKMYIELKKLVDEFNGLYSMMTLCIKIMSLLLLCGSAYVALRKYGSLNVAATVLLALIIGSVLQRQMRILRAMGNVYTQSALWKQSWLTHVGTDIFETNDYIGIRIIQSISLLQFRVGDFYGVTPQTILTFFSVTTTYLIVLLQIY